MQLKGLIFVTFMLGIGLGFSLGSPLITHNQDYSVPSTECGPCGWIHYRDGNRNAFTASDVTENIL